LPESDLHLPTAETQQVCDLCQGSGEVEDGDETISCPQCQQQAVESQEMALAVATAAANGASSQIPTQTITGNTLQPSAFNGAEEQCPNCKGVRYFSELVMNDEGKPIRTTIPCGRCNGNGFITIPLYSPVLAQEKALESKWPTEPLEINWPWVHEPDPVVGTIVGWNWKTEEVAVITKQPQFFNMKPWRVIIEVQPMPKHLLSCLVICTTEPLVHKNVIWYADWTRTGQKQIKEDAGQFEQDREVFSGKCIIQELK
jgi:hypothetical protein